MQILVPGGTPNRSAGAALQEVPDGQHVPSPQSTPSSAGQQENSADPAQKPHAASQYPEYLSPGANSVHESPATMRLAHVLEPEYMLEQLAATHVDKAGQALPSGHSTFIELARLLSSTAADTAASRRSGLIMPCNSAGSAMVCGLSYHRAVRAAHGWAWAATTARRLGQRRTSKQRMAIRLV